MSGLYSYEGFFVNGLMDGIMIMRYLLNEKSGEALYKRGILIRKKEIDTPHNKYHDAQSYFSVDCSHIVGQQARMSYISDKYEECVKTAIGYTRIARSKTNRYVKYQQTLMRDIDNDGKIEFMRQKTSICTYSIDGNIDIRYDSAVRFY